MSADVDDLGDVILVDADVVIVLGVADLTVSVPFVAMVELVEIDVAEFVGYRGPEACRFRSYGS